MDVSEADRLKALPMQDPPADQRVASLDLTDLIVATPTDQAAPVTLRQGDQFRLGVIS